MMYIVEKSGEKKWIVKDAVTGEAIASFATKWEAEDFAAQKNKEDNRK